MSNSWVDDLFQGTLGLDSALRDDEIQFNIASFNILAEAYCSKRSQRNLPKRYANVAFNRDRRKSLIRETLTKMSRMFDIICLQELDDLLFKDVSSHMSDLGYSWVSCKRGGSCRVSPDIDKDLIPHETTTIKNSKSDGCCTFYLKSKWRIHSVDVVHFDDLADENRQSVDITGEEDHRSTGEDIPTKLDARSRSYNSLYGIISSYKRCNSALILNLELRGKALVKNLIVANAHLYWHPGYEYVKLSQAHYLMQRVARFAEKCNGRKCAVIVCGDLNSKANSSVYKYMAEGKVDARLVAPWTFHYNELEEQIELARQMTELSIDEGYSNDQDPVMIKNDVSPITEDSSTSTIALNDDDIFPIIVDKSASIRSCDVDSDSSPQKVKYLLDITLNKFTRWLRILGQDAVLETENEERLRTGEGKMILFERSRREKRVLLTTSKTLLHRKDCPPGTFLINPSTLSELENALVDLLILNGVTIDPTKVLTRCVVCNGNIIEVLDQTTRSQIFSDFGSPDLSDEVEHVYRCDCCGQGYWWSIEPQSTASRVKDAAIHLLRLCIRGGVPIKGDLDFFYYDGNEEDKYIGQKQRQNHSNGGIHEVMEWLNNSALSNPIALRSAYTSPAGELIPFTNVTSDFVGLLDYIFYDKMSLRLVDRLDIPKSFPAMNRNNILNGHLLPSDCWPSDHLCIGASFILSGPKLDISAVPPLVTAIPSAYNPMHHSTMIGCTCGCVPKIPSLFEMAELRKHARLKTLNHDPK